MSLTRGELLLEVKSIAMSVQEGQSTRVQCPSCMDAERSMSVTKKDHQILFKCFRNKCGVGGIIPLRASPWDELVGKVSVPEKKVPERDPAELVNLPEGHERFLPVWPLSVQPKWDVRRKMVMYPVTDYYGRRIGYVQRHYKELNDWWNGSKATNVIEDESVPWAHFPQNVTRSDSLYVVEDVPSSEALSAQGIPSCALMGTNITTEVLTMFKHYGINHMYICLDNDALAKAVHLKRSLELTFDSVTVLFLDKDPKDMSQEEIITKFNLQEKLTQ